MTNNHNHDDITYMQRALQLAALGEGAVSPNPMVGAVITARGRIIGQGWHRRYGGPHAEVNAVADVAEADLHLLPESTIYVTLEPCSHWGKTPPCSRLIIDKGIRRVVVGCEDPNPKVAGRGLRLLREAGKEVVCGVLEQECRHINRRFMTAHRRRRPWILLKFARTADGFIGTPEGFPSLRISTPLSQMWMHRERASVDAIMAGSRTVFIDDPRLDSRLWPGKDPVAVSFASAASNPEARILSRPHILMPAGMSLDQFMSDLFENHSVTSLMVEGGRETLLSFINAGLYDELRIETSPLRAAEILSMQCPGLSAVENPGFIRQPQLPEDLTIVSDISCGENRIQTLLPSSSPY